MPSIVLPQLIKQFAKKVGMDDTLRKSYVEFNFIGERARIALYGRPSPSSAILLAGSGRSGTTWLQEVLCALPGVQPIFEPLHPRFNAEVRRLTGYDTQDPYIRAWYLRPDEEKPEWTALLEKTLTGQIRNYWTDYERITYFPNRYLIKVVRANMMLAYLHQHFQPKIIYILRHPCAVINSRLIVEWHADVQDILVQKKLMNDYCTPYMSQMLQEKDRIGAHAVWWAVENRVALDQLRRIPHFLVYYEQMVMQPKRVVNALLHWLGYDNVPEKLVKILSQPSRMSSVKLQYTDKQDRLFRWKDSLSLPDCQRILNWARCFGLEMYNEQPLPINLEAETEALR